MWGRHAKHFVRQLGNSFKHSRQEMPLGAGVWTKPKIRDTLVLHCEIMIPEKLLAEAKGSLRHYFVQDAKQHAIAKAVDR